MQTGGGANQEPCNTWRHKHIACVSSPPKPERSEQTRYTDPEHRRNGYEQVQAEELLQDDLQRVRNGRAKR